MSAVINVNLVSAWSRVGLLNCNVFSFASLLWLHIFLDSFASLLAVTQHMTTVQPSTSSDHTHTTTEGTFVVP